MGESGRLAGSGTLLEFSHSAACNQTASAAERDFVKVDEGDRSARQRMEGDSRGVMLLRSHIGARRSLGRRGGTAGTGSNLGGMLVAALSRLPSRQAWRAQSTARGRGTHAGVSGQTLGRGLKREAAGRPLRCRSTSSRASASNSARCASMSGFSRPGGGEC